jgi:hypothetical protein
MIRARSGPTGRLASFVWAFTALWAAFLLLSLHFGWLDAFFFDASNAHVQGIDFFPVERGWLNLLAGRSIFDTFHSGYGPYATWLVYHPALVVVIGPLLMAFSPWTAYALWSVLSLGLMGLSAFFIARQGSGSLRKALVFLLFLGFPAALMLHVGNVQAVLVLSCALIFAAVDDICATGVSRRNQAMLLAGLLISLFSKPVVFAMLPLLLLLKETRRPVLRALGIYVLVSLVFLSVPLLNPVALGWGQRWFLATHPEIVAQAMNPFTNGFTITAPMQDNAIHWLAMRGLGGFRMLHIDVYSLPALLDGWLGTRTPDALYAVPSILVLELSVLVFFVRDRKARLDAALMTLMAASLLLFLSYGLVWEYHFTAVFPVAGLLLMRGLRNPIDRAILLLGALVWLPGLYVLMRHRDAASLSVQNLLRLERVGPVVLIFLLLLVRAALLALRSPAGLGLPPRAKGTPPA